MGHSPEAKLEERQGARLTQPIPPNAVLTGSRKYGTPKDESDIDLAVLVSEADYDRIMSCLTDRECPAYYGAMHISETLEGSQSIRLGRLNLILCFNPDVFKLWEKGTKALFDRRPVTREAAMALFHELREKA